MRLVTVFLSFVLGHDVMAKMFGIGLAAAVLIDATLIRMVLVPATMELLGDRNWWLPNWLDRLLPRLTVDGPRADPIGTDATDDGSEPEGSESRWRQQDGLDDVNALLEASWSSQANQLDARELYTLVPETSRDGLAAVAGSPRNLLFGPRCWRALKLSRRSRRG